MLQKTFIVEKVLSVSQAELDLLIPKWLFRCSMVLLLFYEHFFVLKLIMFMKSNILKVYYYTVNKNKLLINLIYQKIVSVKAHVNQHHHIKTNKKSLSEKQNKQ